MFPKLLIFISVIFLGFQGNNALAQSGESGQTLMPDSEIFSKVAGLARMYNIDSATLAGYDKIITFKREVFVGKVYNITFTDVRFTCPPDNYLNTISKSQISQILYGDGRRDVFIALEGRTVKQKELVDSSRIIIKNQKDWMKVIVTEDPSLVANLTLIGDIKAKYEGEMGNVSNEELMRQAGIILKKRASLMKAHCVLIETKFFKKSYGDLPSVEVTARAFGVGSR